MFSVYQLNLIVTVHKNIKIQFPKNELFKVSNKYKHKIISMFK